MSVTVQQKVFSRDFFDRQDPTEGLGELLIPFSFSNIYDEVDKHRKLREICAELYEKVLIKLQSGDLGKDINFEIYDYKDSKQDGKESPRRYFTITRETNRKTRITILVRFLPYGNKLYVGVDSFVLGNTNWLKLIGILALTALPFSCYGLIFLQSTLQGILGSFNSYGSNQGISTLFQGFLTILQYTCCCIFPWSVFSISFLWLKSIRNFRYEGNLLLAFRQSFNQILNSRSFNVDDVLMTLKSVLPLILSSIQEVFANHNLPINTLNEFAARIQIINNIHNQNVYGQGNAVAGAGGQANVNN